MDISLEQLISEAFPAMKRSRYPNTDFGYWGYMIPDGWFSLIVQFAKALEEIDPKGLVIHQVKEKMNRLVICCECDDTEAKSEAVENLEILIEQLSQNLCGRCGESLLADHSCHLRWKNRDQLVRWATEYVYAQSNRP